MIYLIAFVLVLIFLTVLIALYEIRYRNNQAKKIQGKEDQQRYGAKYSVGKIVSYSKKWWGWKKK